MKQQNSKNLELAQEWFLRAQDDELSIKYILEDYRGSPNTACFLAQQMAEKYLKGFLVFHKKRFPKIHILNKIFNLIYQSKSFNRVNSKRPDFRLFADALKRSGEASTGMTEGKCKN